MKDLISLMTKSNRSSAIILYVVFLGVMTGSGLATVALARDVSFKWSPNPEPLAGYKLYYKIGTDNLPPYVGKGLPLGDSPILLSKVTTVKLSGLSELETYHFALTAYNDTAESDFSAIVTVYPDPIPKIIKMRDID